MPLIIASALLQKVGISSNPAEAVAAATLQKPRRVNPSVVYARVISAGTSVSDACSLFCGVALVSVIAATFTLVVLDFLARAAVDLCAVIASFSFCCRSQN